MKEFFNFVSHHPYVLCKVKFIIPILYFNCNYINKRSFFYYCLTNFSMNQSGLLQIFMTNFFIDLFREIYSSRSSLKNYAVNYNLKSKETLLTNYEDFSRINLSIVFEFYTNGFFVLEKVKTRIETFVSIIILIILYFLIITCI